MTIEHTVRPAHSRTFRPSGPWWRMPISSPPEMLGGMIAGYLEKTTRDIWFVTVEGGHIVGFGYCEPERMTSGTWNLLAIGVLARRRGRGVGGAMMRYLEDRLRSAGERVLIVETMGTPAFRQTRAFYRANGYTKGLAFESSTSPAETRSSSGSISEDRFRRWTETLHAPATGAFMENLIPVRDDVPGDEPRPAPPARAGAAAAAAAAPPRRPPARAAACRELVTE